MEEMDASGTFKISWMVTLGRQPLEEMDLLGTSESSCWAGAGDLAGDDEQAIIRDPFSSTLASDTGGQPNKRRGSPPVGRNEKRIKNLSNGGDQISDEETQCLLFSCHSGGAAGATLRDNPTSTQNLQQISSFKIDKVKHKVFLSHSGEQKDFVEQLCMDLEARGYIFPFFDQRQHSLPKGKDFVPFIKEAAQLCHAAVIILSEKYLFSKWPMIELAEFHAAQQAGNKQLSMLPLFYKLAVDDLDDRAIEDRWMPRWRQLAKDDRRIDVEKWGAAVRALRKANGLVFGKSGTSEVGYRKEIVQSIFRLSPPDLLYGSWREMVGYDRMCEIAKNRFVRHKGVGAAVLGLYGTTGRGKTTMCKALCDRFFAEFSGRVCHVELGEMSTVKRQKMMGKRTKLMLKSLKLMLKKLCGIEGDVLDSITDVCQGMELLRDHVHREPVFLAIDNVIGDESSLAEAREYLKVGFHPHSRILITSRSKSNVQELLSGGEFCIAMPRLRVNEAGEIFLRSAAPMRSISGLTDEERRIVGLCIQQCLFESEGYESDSVCWDSDNDEVSCEPHVEEKKLLSMSDVWESGWKSYHPLALSALGDFFRRYSSNLHILGWKDHLEKNVDPFKDFWSSPDGIGKIIGLQFSSLHPREQLLFLDIALYSKFFSAYENGFDLHRSRWLEWVSELHDVTAAVMERRLQDLTRFGMINYDDACIDEENNAYTVPVPTLYKEFAEWYATEHGLKGLKKNSWGVCQSSGATQNRHSSLSDLVRLRVFELSRASGRLVACKTMQELHNLEVLQLHSCPNLTELDLHGLDSLRHLELVELEKLVTVTLSGSSGAEEDLGIYESLQSVRLDDLDSLTHGPDLRSCRSLHWLSVGFCPKLANLEQISECRDLKDLVLMDLDPQQWASIPIVESLHSLQHFNLQSVGYGIDVRGVIRAVEGLECWDKALMVGELLRHLRSLRVNDLSLAVGGGWIEIEWNRRGCDKLKVWDSTAGFREFEWG
ncbi:hypothetical protein KC19_9G056300 [Ceratodon purpureus]|uniref:TIR domain-containing protein n=1 Tax=Ceratodon purpureus TaxID=3225 RepID=A0A8T0GT46_CERPU|nr:hypothetical protein KC19_9G056300 [Ceratodon purpureus]